MNTATHPVKHALVGLLLTLSAFSQVVPGPPVVAPNPPTSSISGNLQTATGGVVTNGTLNFILSQPAVVSGTSSIAANSVSCYTSTVGNVVGVPDPLATPVLSTNTASGTLPQGTYYVKFVYIGNGGTTSVPSPEATAVLSAQGTLTMSAPAFQPASATGFFGVYIGTSSGTETLQGAASSWAPFSQSTPLVAGSALPSSNNSACNIWFSDSLIPTGSYYTVTLTNKNDSALAGYPQSWCTFGGAGATINVSQGAPTGNCGTNGVFYPTPIYANPQAAQSISNALTLTGPLTLTNNLAVTGWLTATGNVTATAGQNTITAYNVNGVVYVDGVKYPQTDAGLTAALTAAGANGTVVIPPSANISVTTVHTISTNYTTLRCEPGAVLTTASSGAINVSGAHDTIRDCQFVGPGTGSGPGSALLVVGGASYTKILDNNFQNYPGASTCTILAPDRTASVASPVSFVWVERNHFSNNSGTSICSYDQVDHIWIEDNWTDFSAGIAGMSGIIVHAQDTGTAPTYVTVANNKGKGATGDCVEIGAFGGNVPSRVVLSGNQCTLTGNSSSAGLSLAGATQFTYSNNTVEAGGLTFTGNPPLECINCQQGTITGNVANLGTQNAVGTYPILTVSASNGTTSDVSVSGNTVSMAYTGAGAGVCYYSAVTQSANSISNVNFSGNTCDLTGSTGKNYGFLLQTGFAGSSLQNENISGNLLIGAAQATDGGIVFEQDAGTMSHNVVGVNYVFNFTTPYSTNALTPAVGLTGADSFTLGTPKCLSGGAAGTTSPAACGTMNSGILAVPSTQTTYTVNTSAVTATSEIHVQQITDNSGLPSSPTCNATASNPMQSARSAGTSFTFTLTSVANVTCYRWWVVN